jgi:predicted permease
METLWHDVRYAARMLTKTPGGTAIVVLTLALGIGANTTIFSAVYGVLLRPLPYPEPDELVFVSQTSLAPRLLVGGKETPPRPGGEPVPFSPPNFVDYKEQARSFAAFGAWASTTRNLTGGGPERVNTASVTSGFFEALRVPPLYGRLLTAEDERAGQSDVVVLGHGVWQRRYGADPSIVGRDVPVGGVRHRVVGVMPPGFSFPAGTELWMPLVFDASEMTQRNSHYLDVVARLGPGVSVAAAQAELRAIALRLGEQYPESNKQFSARVVSMVEQISGDVRPVLLLLLGAVGFVLLIACANFAHLMVARGASREREMAVRTALGAPRSRLLRQWLTESLLLGLLGGAAGMMIAVWGVDLLRTMGPAALPRRGDIALDSSVLLYALGISLATGLVFGLAPALSLTRPCLQTALKEGVHTGRSPRRLPGVLVAGEVAWALVLLAGAGLLVFVLWGLLNTHPGFDAQNVLTADVVLPRATYRRESQRVGFVTRALERIRALPGVEMVGETSNIPLSGSSSVYGFLMEGQEPRAGGGPIPFANFRVVTPDYLRALRVPLVRGRGIEEGDTAGAPQVVVINEVARFWPGRDALGKRIELPPLPGQGTQTLQVIGVVRDSKYRAVLETVPPTMYLPLDQHARLGMSVFVRFAGGNPGPVLEAARGAVRGLDAALPLMNPRTLTQQRSNSLYATRLVAILLGVLGGLGLLLAAFGLYGMLAYTVEQRIREIGIRVALGAHPGDIFRLVVRQGMLPVVLGVVAGVGGALAATRLLQRMLYGVAAHDPATFAATALLLGMVALAACAIPARHATRVDPMVALRYE